jgi:hypothetical protein
MQIKKYLLLLTISALLISCWKYRNGTDGGYNTQQNKVWGYKPVYGTEPEAKNILYTSGAKPVISGGNIYAYQDYIFQMESGLGIHVIDNSNPSVAVRIGFITVKGCSQISIKDGKIYTNSYDDLVVLGFSNFNTVAETSRLKGVFTEYRYGSPLALPPASGYYECPAYDKFVTGWVKDSVYQNCYKN